MHKSNPNQELSKKLFAKAKQLIPGGVNSPVRSFRSVGGSPLFMQKANGALLQDVDGNEYIDLIGSWGPAILGHNRQIVNDAIRDTLKNGFSFGTCHPLEIQMADEICINFPAIESVRMVNSGTEATMTCIRLARGFTDRKKIIKFAGCYHGHVDSLLVAAGSGALTHSAPDSAGVPEELAKLSIVLPFNDENALEKAFASNANEIAAVILEIIPANAGLFFPKKSFLEKLQFLCKKYNSVLIADEVMTGYRVNEIGAQKKYNLKPDLCALGKIIGGGLPVGAFGGRREIMNELAPIGKVYQAGTLSGNALALAAGLAQIKELKRINAWQDLEEKGAYLEGMLREILAKSPTPTQFHRVASMFCIFFTDKKVESLDDAMSTNQKIFQNFFRHMLAQGILLAPSPYETCFLSLAHTKDDLEKIAEAVESFCTNF